MPGIHWGRFGNGCGGMGGTEAKQHPSSGGHPICPKPRDKRMHRPPATLIISLFIVASTYCRVCQPKLLDKIIAIKAVKFDEYFLEKNPLESISKAMDGMDTSNCFEVQRRDG